MEKKQVSGSTVTSYWATKGRCPSDHLSFAIGGSDADYLNAWKNILGSIQTGETAKLKSSTVAVVLEVQIRVEILKVVLQGVHVYLIVKKSSSKVSNFSLLLLFLC